MVALTELRWAPAEFIGIQDGFGTLPSIELYVLKAPVGGHPTGSSVSRQTIERHGYFLPPLPVAPPWAGKQKVEA
jgi:hypothetical protein